MNTSKTEIDKYIDRISQFKRISKKRELDLGKIIAESSDEILRENAIKELVEANLFLVVSIVLKKKNICLEIMDLIYEGNLALVKAARKYSYTRASFGTFAHRYITNAFKDFKSQNKLIYLPTIFRDYYKIVRDFEAKSNITATPEEISGLLGVNIDRAKDVRRALDIHVFSTEKVVGEDTKWCDVHGEVDPSLNRIFLQIDISEFLEKLSPIQKDIIKMVYLEEGLDLVEAGKRIGHTKQYVEAVCKRAMTEMKRYLMMAWDKDHKTKTIVMSEGKITQIKRKGKRLFRTLIDAENQTNKKIYKEVLAHYLGK